MAKHTIELAVVGGNLEERGTIAGIEDFDELNRALDKLDIPSKFREYALRMDGITCSAQEWKESEEYMLPQLRALIGRYSKLGDNAFYKMYFGVDTTIKKAIESE